MSKNQTAAAETATAAAATDAPRPAETKAQAFVRIVSRRMSNALSAIKLMEGNSNPANYEYTSAHYKAMIAALRKQVNELEAVYVAGGKKEAAVGFGFAGEVPASSTSEDESDADEGDADE